MIVTSHLTRLVIACNVALLGNLEISMVSCWIGGRVAAAEDERVSVRKVQIIAAATVCGSF